MGKPPTRLAMKRIVKHFFANKRPNPFMYSEDCMTKVVDCWEEHGKESEICKQYEREYERAVVNDTKFAKYLDGLQLDRRITTHLPHSDYKYQAKGKFQEFYTQNSKHDIHLD